MHPLTRQWDLDHHYTADYNHHDAPPGRPCEYCGQAIEKTVGAFIHGACLEAELLQLYSDLRRMRYKRFHARLAPDPGRTSHDQD